nr:MAG TPA: hypothetical protein [Caudoviricetes sp.]
MSGKVVPKSGIRRKLKPGFFFLFIRKMRKRNGR